MRSLSLSLYAQLQRLGLERVKLYRVSGRVGFERSGIGSSRVYHRKLFGVSGFVLRGSGLIRVMNLVRQLFSNLTRFAGIHRKHNISSTFQTL